MKIKVNKNDPLRIEKEEALSIANDLGYSRNTLLIIATANSIATIDNAMITARRTEL